MRAGLRVRAGVGARAGRRLEVGCHLVGLGRGAFTVSASVVMATMDQTADIGVLEVGSRHQRGGSNQRCERERGDEGLHCVL